MLKEYIQLLRPKHWIKNVFVLAGIVFGKQLLESHSLLLAIQGFACFCGLSSAVYIFNDLRDREADRQHPLKKDRPLASGKIPASNAKILGLVLTLVSLWWSVALGWHFAAIGLAYLALNVAYTFWLKDQPIIDVIAISLGFVLRAVAGVILMHAELSPWVIVCTFCLCLFLGFGKRRGELGELGAQAGAFRKVHELYTPVMLDHMLSVTSGITVVAFLMYTLHPHTQAWIGNNYLLYTMPLVLYGIFRFSLLIQSGKAAGPVEVILRDRPFQATLIGWLLLCLGIIYGGQLRDMFAGGN